MALTQTDYQPLTPALMHCCSLNTPPRRNWGRDSSRPSLTPKALGCCDRSKGKFSDCIWTKKKGVSQKHIGKRHEQTKCCNNFVPNQTPAATIHWPFTLRPHFHLEPLSFTLDSPKNLKVHLNHYFFHVCFVFWADISNVWFVKLWKCTYTQHIQYIYLVGIYSCVCSLENVAVFSPQALFPLECAAHNGALWLRLSL